MTTLRLVGVVVLVALSGCVAEGVACTGGGICDGADSVFMCENGTLKRYACPGMLGCATNTEGKTFVCDFRGSLNSSPCPAIALEQKAGFCQGDREFMTCQSKPYGRVWLSQACSACTSSGLAATCAP